MKTSLITSCLLLLITPFVFSQEPIRVKLNPQTRTNSHPNSHGWQTLARPLHDSIGFRGDMFLPTYPDLSAAKDTAFGEMYFDHGTDTTFPRIVFFLMTDFTSDDARFWVDTNINYDFTDDGPSIGYNMVDSFALIKLSNPENPKLETHIRLFPNRWSGSLDDDLERKAFYEEMFGNHPNTAGFPAVGIEHHLNDQVLRIVAKDVVIEGDSFRIGLGDGGSDGRFNDDSTDSFYLGTYGDEGLSDDFFAGGGKWMKSGTLIKPNACVYRVVEVEEYGNYLDLVISREPFPSLTNGSQIPDFNFETHEGDSTTLYELLENKPYTLIDVWGSWCGPCRQEVPRLKELQETLADELQILAVTSDNKESALEFIAEQEITWPGVWITKEFADAATNSSFPFHILIGPDKQVIKFGIHPPHVEKAIATDKE